MSDKIVKTATLKAPLQKVWKAISDSASFGTWFGATFEGPFVEGQTVRGAIAKTQVDDEIARHQEPYVGMRCDLMIERIVPGQLLAYRWHPGADPAPGPDAPTTLVTFELEEIPEGTRLT
ncbi:MAG TPA: SRPBCC domain-containing protein, partial [Vulgatibacter sp.]